MAYTTPAKVAALLGVTLTGGQQSLITDDLEPAMRAHVDRVTGRSWGGSSPVTAELHEVSGGVVYLKNRPVTAITAATVRTQSIGSDAVALVDGSTYELVDPANGVLLVSAVDGSLASVSYTHGGTAVPADIALATAWLVAAQMTDVLVSDPSLRGVKKYAAGSGDIAIEFDTQAAAVQAQRGLDILSKRAAFIFA